jgi:transcriptional regulator with XRE-family HTH domain
MHATIKPMENEIEKQEKISPPMIAIDGSSIKAIREEKKLTQLYIANVVGVTTDTISRWENNRYPNIKKENAEKLASALEVDLATILKSDGPTEAIVEEAVQPEKKRSSVTSLFIIAIVAIIFIAAILMIRFGPAPVVSRILPRYGAPGEILPVKITISGLGEGKAGLIVKERLPDGWILVSSSPQIKSGKSPSGEIKWLIPSGTGDFRILYTVKVPSSAPLKSKAAFRGSMISHSDGLSQTEAIGGDQHLTVDGIHWADKNGDGRIDDDEIMPAYYLTEEMKGLGLDWNKIESIWNAGGYHWDRGKEDFLIK